VKKRSQRGTIDNRPVLAIFAILAVVAWLSWPGGGPGAHGGVATAWIAGIGAGLLALLVIGRFAFHRKEVRQLRHMNEVARALGSELRREVSGGFGRATVANLVTYRRGERTVTIDLTSGATATTLDMGGAKADPFSLRYHEGAETVTDYGMGTPRPEEFFDARVRMNLERMERIGRDYYRAVSVIVTPASVTITKHGRISARETLLFLNLCWPVFDRAAAVCFGQPVAAPAAACPTCGGECCLSRDDRHDPVCGCAPADGDYQTVEAGRA
jgi:hypothetical protein